MVLLEVSIRVILILDQPRTVIAGEQDIRVLSQTHVGDGIQHPPNIEIDLLNDISVESAFALSLEISRRIQSRVWHRMWHVNKEGLRLISPDKRDGFICISSSQCCHIGRLLDQLFIPVQIGDAIVTGGRSVEVVKSLPRGEQIHEETCLRVFREVPFPETGRGITLRFQNFGNRNLVLMQDWVNLLGVTSFRDPHGITACHQGSS